MGQSGKWLAELPWGKARNIKVAKASQIGPKTLIRPFSPNNVAKVHMQRSTFSFQRYMVWNLNLLRYIAMHNNKHIENRHARGWPFSTPCTTCAKLAGFVSPDLHRGFLALCFALFCRP